jgi:hypothetical protein
MDRLAGSWNGKRGGRKVERVPPGQAVASVAVEAGRESYQDSMQVLSSAEWRLRLPGDGSACWFMEW